MTDETNPPPEEAPTSAAQENYERVKAVLDNVAGDLLSSGLVPDEPDAEADPKGALLSRLYKTVMDGLYGQNYAKPSWPL